MSDGVINQDFGDSRYLPAIIEVSSLIVGVTNATLETIALDDNQYLMVGERQQIPNSSGISNKTYGLFVDADGVTINAALPDRTVGLNQYALYVDGDVKVSGNIHASNIILDATFLNDMASIASAASSNPWHSLPNRNTIYFDGNVAIANRTYAGLSGHPLYVYESGDRTIHHTHLALENTQLSKLNVGIIGNAAQSPVIFHSASAPIEFNVGREDSYYTERYTELYASSPGVITTRPSEVPRYTHTSNAPHFIIDRAGNVGIKTSLSPTIKYNKRYIPGQDLAAIYTSNTETMSLSVHGAIFASNMLIYDPDTRSAKDVHELFARVLDNFMPANQVNPGYFALGDYTFPIRLSVASPIEESYGLSVGEDAHFKKDVIIDDTMETSNAITQFLYNAQGATFASPVTMDDLLTVQGIQVNQGGISVVKNEADGSVSYENVQFTVFDTSYSNINPFNAGFTTPGRIGAGVLANEPSDLPVYSQMAIRLRDNLPKTFELELMDLRDAAMTKVAFLGHTHTDPTLNNDGSFVIATPSSNDSRYYKQTYQNPYQNIYLYPGHDISTPSSPLIRPDNPPTLGAFAISRLSGWSTGRVGINTFTPKAELHVQGSIIYSNDLLKLDPITNVTSTIGTWTRHTIVNTNPADIDVVGPSFTGLEWTDASAAHVGINTIPSAYYGAVIAGGVKILNGLYDADDKEIVSWTRVLDDIDVAPSGPDINAPKLYTQGPVGIGVLHPEYVLELQNRLEGATYMRMLASDDNSKIGIKMQGFDNSWVTQVDTNKIAWEVYAETFPASAGPNASTDMLGKRAVQAVFNPTIKTYQVFVNKSSNINIHNNNALSSSAALTVDGTLNVIGDVHITGNYFQNSIMSTPNVAPEVSITELTSSDDVIIAGTNVHIVPTSGYVSIGFDKTILDATTQQIATSTLNIVPFRVHQRLGFNAGSPVVMSLTSAQDRCYLEFVNNQKTRVWMGMDDSGRFSVSTANYTTGVISSKPFLSFQDRSTYFAMGLNTQNPATILHVTDSTSSNLFRVTREVMSDGSTGSACIQMETRTPTSTRRMWSFNGPNFTASDRLTLAYHETSELEGKELFAFGKNGALGIGNMNPEYALDIKSEGRLGSLRLWNNDSSAQPQLIFQSGPSNVFGSDSQTDFRMLCVNNRFEFTAQTLGTGSVSLFEADAFGNTGFGRTPDSRYRLNVQGGINMSDKLYLNGVPLFDMIEEGSLILKGTSLTIAPDVNAGGSFLVNTERTTGTGNSFQVFATQENQNALILDSLNQEVQLSFRTRSAGLEPTSFIYRQFQQERRFGLELLAPAGSNEQITAGHDGWCNVVGWEPLDPQRPYMFTMTHHGDIRLVSNDPVITFGPIDVQSNPSSTPSVAAASIGKTTGGDLWMTAAEGRHIGIGTRVPMASVHIYNDVPHTTPALYVEHSDDSSAPFAIFGELEEPDVIFMANGQVGINAGLAPTEGLLLDVNGVVGVADGDVGAPSLTFRDNKATGFYRPLTASMALDNDIESVASSVNGIETHRVLSTGAFAVGTTSPLAHFHIDTQDSTFRTSNVGQGALRIDYNLQVAAGSPIMEVNKGDDVLFRINNDGNVGFGTNPNKPFHIVTDEFLIDSTGTFTSNVDFLKNIMVYGDVRYKGVVTQDSDRTIKTDLVKIDNALDRIEALTGYTYVMVADAGTGIRHTGLIAQDVASVLPEAVSTHPNTGIMGVAYGNMMGLIIEAIKELRADVKQLQAVVKPG